MKNNSQNINYQLVTHICGKDLLSKLIKWIDYVDRTSIHKENVMFLYSMYELTNQLN